MVKMPLLVHTGVKNEHVGTHVVNAEKNSAHLVIEWPIFENILNWIVQILWKETLNLVLQAISWYRTVHSLKGTYLEVHIVSIMTQRYIFKRSSDNLVAKKVKIFTSSLKFLFSIQLLFQVLIFKPD